MAYRLNSSFSQIGSVEENFGSSQRTTSDNIQHVGQGKIADAIIMDQLANSNELRLFYPRNSIDMYNPPVNDKLPGIPKGPVFSICVRYVATGHKHTDRTPAQIALVNEEGNIVRNIYIKPETPVVSYLTPVTGIDEETIAKYGFHLREGTNILKEALSPDVVLVGHCPGPDIKVLGLKKGKHYRTILDLSKLWWVWNPTYQIYTRFSFEHLLKNVLNVPYEFTLVSRAVNCVRLWNYYVQCRSPGHEWRLKMLRRQIIESPRVNRYGRVKTLDGVCLGMRGSCLCECKSSPSEQKSTIE